MSQFVQWFVENKKDLTDVEQERKFQARALHELVHVFTYIIEDIQNQIGRAHV